MIFSNSTVIMAVTFSLLKRDCEYTDGYICYSIPIPAVIGIVFGSVAFLLILAVIIFFCVRRQRRRNKRKMGLQEGDDEGAMRYAGTAKAEPITFNPHAY